MSVENDSTNSHTVGYVEIGMFVDLINESFYWSIGAKLVEDSLVRWELSCHVAPKWLNLNFEVVSVVIDLLKRLNLFAKVGDVRVSTHVRIIAILRTTE